MPYRPSLGSARQIRLKKNDELELLRFAETVELSIADVHRKAFSIGLRAIKKNPALLFQDPDSTNGN